MVFYLPQGPDLYGGAFVGFSTDEHPIADHIIFRNGTHIAVTPRVLTLEAFHSKNFIELKEKIEMQELWLIDRVKTLEPVVQIVDHRNLSGENPLAGRTPIGDRPRFPDVSNVYSNRSLDLPQQVVSTVGHKRFVEAQGEDISEVAAHVALSAAYAGTKIVGIGWNNAIDKEGRILGNFLSRTILGRETGRLRR